ncbi:hypothetical protein [Streptomyces sp. NPDC004783]|uniref:hypothetical protein n=1 Tax=Streptomyces sp. NPDC004783 TaxID=3154459 RepID=UPI0033BE0A24
MKRYLWPLMSSALLLTAACAGEAESIAEQYDRGYRFGQGLPATHLGNPTASDDTAAADSECGEHAVTDGMEATKPWMAGCIDGALGRPASPPASS